MSETDPTPAEGLPPDPPAAPPVQAAPAVEDTEATSGQRFVRFNVLSLVVGILALGVGIAVGGLQADPAPVPVFPHDPVGFAGHDRWNDGKAEVARYRAYRSLYGQERDYELVRITVKEEFDPRRRVKPDAPRSGAVTALKAIASHMTPTGRPYQYHQQVICRVARDDPRHLLDATLSSQEWCGNTFLVLTQRGGELERTVHSYWDGEGDRRDRLPAGTWLEDQLPLTLRALDWDAQGSLAVSLLPTILANRAPATSPVSAMIELAASDEQVRVPAGAFSCYHLVVRAGEQESHYWIGRDELRPLVKFQDATGRGELRSLERTVYWQDPK